MSKVSTRRERIAEAGVRLIGAEGLHALTHRRIDAMLELPAGSTSYYARTRRELVLLIAQSLSARVTEQLVPGPPADHITPSEAADRVIAVLDRLMEDADVQRTRFAIMVDYPDDAEVSGALMLSPEFLEASVAHTMRTFTALGVPDPQSHVIEVLELLDALLLQRLVVGRRGSERGILQSYYAGLLAPAG